MQKHVYFVRHGESDANADGIQRGGAERLTDKGKQQASFVAERIAGIGVDALVSSSLPRALETAEEISKRTGLPVEASPLFIERVRPSILTGDTYENPKMIEMSRQIFEGYASKGHRHSDEENFDDLQIRIRQALDFLEQHPAERICVVTHYVFMRILAAAVWAGGLLTPTDVRNAMLTMHMDNTGIIHLSFSPEPRISVANGIPMHPWEIISWNESVHLK
jgi:probable phosphoglycerate mutase